MNCVTRPHLQVIPLLDLNYMIQINITQFLNNTNQSQNGGTYLMIKYFTLAVKIHDDRQFGDFVFFNFLINRYLIAIFSNPLIIWSSE